MSIFNRLVVALAVSALVTTAAVAHHSVRYHYHKINKHDRFVITKDYGKMLGAIKYSPNKRVEKVLIPKRGYGRYYLHSGQRSYRFHWFHRPHHRYYNDYYHHKHRYHHRRGHRHH